MTILQFETMNSIPLYIIMLILLLTIPIAAACMNKTLNTNYDCSFFSFFALFIIIIDYSGVAKKNAKLAYFKNSLNLMT